MKTHTSTKDSKAARLLVRPDALFANVGNEIDTLAQHMAEIPLVLNKSQNGASNQYKIPTGTVNNSRRWGTEPTGALKTSTVIRSVPLRKDGAHREDILDPFT